MDPCKAKEPRVINNALIQKCVNEQYPSGEAGRLAQEEGVPLKEIEYLRLEYLNILRIDHLWMLESLTKLSLSQNFIEKIENLETLVHLKELDMSFNKISQIENLDLLVNLEILSFYENRISVIKNMDNLKKLTIFSIGKNHIEDADNVVYLRRFQNLKSLNMSGNVCAEQSNFRFYIATYLPQLLYYEYRMISNDERKNGLEIYRVELQTLEEKESREREIREKKEAEIADAILHADSFVEYLNSEHLFQSLFAEDPEGAALMVIGDEIKEYYDEYEEQFITICKQIFKYGEEQYNIRKAELNQFFETVNQAKQNSQEESIKQMENFLERKAELFYEVRNLQEDVDNNEITMAEYSEKIEECAVRYHDFIHKTWKTLMKLEVTVYEQLEETNQTFEQTLTEMVNTFVENAQGLFTLLRALEVTYSENISECAHRYLTSSNITEDFVMPEELKEIMYDRECLNNALGATHDVHMQLIDGREDRLVQRAKDWLGNIVTNLQKDEITRNRLKVLEINHFLDIQREEFEEIKAVIVGPKIDPDISAALS